jgi:hypothetical protein
LGGNGTGFYTRMPPPVRLLWYARASPFHAHKPCRLRFSCHCCYPSAHAVGSFSSIHNRLEALYTILKASPAGCGYWNGKSESDWAFRYGVQCGESELPTVTRSHSLNYRALGVYKAPGTNPPRRREILGGGELTERLHRAGAVVSLLWLCGIICIRPVSPYVDTCGRHMTDPQNSSLCATSPTFVPLFS